MADETQSERQTAWQDINPPMGLARPQEPQSQSLDRPASSETFRNELTACLTLVAPVGMTEEAKRDWLAVAWATLKDLPADILAMGCRKARQSCDHPSKIVPTIINETKQAMQCRRDLSRDYSQPSLPKPDYCTAAEAAAILKEFGLKRSGEVS